MTRALLFDIFFFLLFGVLLHQASRMLAPFAGPMLCAVVTAMILYPVHQKLECRFNRLGPNGQAFLSLAGVIIFLVLPLAFLVWALAKEIASVIPAVREQVAQAQGWLRALPEAPLAAALNKISLPLWLRQILIEGGLQEKLSEFGQEVVSGLARLGGNLARGAFNFSLDIFLYLFTLFFLLRDGHSVANTWNALLPVDAADRTRINEKIQDTLFGVVRGTFLTALAQGVVAGIGFLLAGVRASLLLGVLSFVAAILPGLGTAIVWLPAAVFYLITGETGRGIFLLLWGVGVSVMDNFLRPFVVGGKANIPFFWLFFALFGGLAVYGASGMILGPLIVALIPIFVDIYRHTYLKR